MSSSLAAGSNATSLNAQTTSQKEINPALKCGLISIVAISSIALFDWLCGGCWRFSWRPSFKRMYNRSWCSRWRNRLVLNCKTIKQIKIPTLILQILPALSMVVLGSLGLTGILQVQQIGWGILGTVGASLILTIISNYLCKSVRGDSNSAVAVEVLSQMNAATGNEKIFINSLKATSEGREAFAQLEAGNAEPWGKLFSKPCSNHLIKILDNIE